MAGYVFSTGAGLYCLLYAEYDLPGVYNQENCFTGIRYYYKQFVHQFWFGLSDVEFREMMEVERRKRLKSPEQMLEEEMRARIRDYKSP